MLRANASGGAAVVGQRVFWFGDDEAAPPSARAFARPRDGVTVSFAAGALGHILVGCTGRLAGGEREGPEPNLFLLQADSPRLSGSGRPWRISHVPAGWT